MIFTLNSHILTSKDCQCVSMSVQKAKKHRKVAPGVSRISQRVLAIPHQPGTLGILTVNYVRVPKEIIVAMEY